MLYLKVFKNDEFQKSSLYYLSCIKMCSKDKAILKFQLILTVKCLLERRDRDILNRTTL